MEGELFVEQLEEGDLEAGAVVGVEFYESMFDNPEIPDLLELRITTANGTDTTLYLDGHTAQKIGQTLRGWIETLHLAGRCGCNEHPPPPNT